MWSTIKYILYKLIYGFYYRYVIYIQTRKIRKGLCVFDSISTVRYIVEKKCSVSRFGDGELRMIAYYLKHGDSKSFNIDTFQMYSDELAERLEEVLFSNGSNCLMCIPYAFKKFSVFLKIN